MTIGSLSFLAFLLGRKVQPNNKLLFVSTICVAFVFSVWFQGKLGWARLLPHSAALLFANFTPIFVAFVAGFACNGLNIRPRTRPFAVAALGLVTLVCLFNPLIRPAVAPPAVSSSGQTKGVVVLQSHDSTCAPASAATLLKLNGIETTEKDMIAACLTSEFGTEALGIYRGLKLGVGNGKLAVRVANRDPYSWAASGQLPNVALVQFPEDEFARAANETYSESSYIPRPFLFTGQGTTEDGHAIVIMDYSDNEWTVADPAIGIVKWSDEEFRTRFTGDALFIEHN